LNISGVLRHRGLVFLFFAARSRETILYSHELGPENVNGPLDQRFLLGVLARIALRPGRCHRRLGSGSKAFRGSTGCHRFHPNCDGPTDEFSEGLFDAGDPGGILTILSCLIVDCRKA